MRWEAYKVFFQITIFRYFVIWFSVVPVIAGLFHAIPSPLILGAGETRIEINLSLPFNWQLLWLSSLCFVVALVIYKIWCPSFVAKYNSFCDYQTYGHDQRWLAWVACDLMNSASAKQKQKFVERLQTKGFLLSAEEAAKNNNIDLQKLTDLDKAKPIIGKNQTVFFFQFNGMEQALGMPVNPTVTDSEKGIFWEVFGRYSENYAYARVIILILLIISLLLFSVVFLQHVYAGGRYVYEWLTVHM